MSDYVTIISVYAPTFGSDEDIKYNFYNLLDATIQGVDWRDKLVLLGDFNARVGKESQVKNGALGNHGMGKMKHGFTEENY